MEEYLNRFGYTEQWWLLILTLNELISYYIDRSSHVPVRMYSSSTCNKSLKVLVIYNLQMAHVLNALLASLNGHVAETLPLLSTAIIRHER